MYLLVSGELPFYDKERKKQFENIKSGSYVFGRAFDNISKDGKDLITRLLDTNPSTRPSVTQVHKHPWFATH